MQAFSAWCGAVHCSNGPLGPLRSAGPTSGRGQYGMLVQRRMEVGYNVPTLHTICSWGVPPFKGPSKNA